MITDEEIYDFIEHRGVKGMHWGVRKSSPASRDATPKEIAKGKGINKKKLAKEVGASVAVAAGAVAAAAFLHKRSQIKISQLPNLRVSGNPKHVENMVEMIAQRNRTLKISEIRKKHGNFGNLTDAQKKALPKHWNVGGPPSVMDKKRARRMMGKLLA
jgi:hypothetical protein